VARRINVKGTSGSGKSTFARELAGRVDVPYVELDALHHGPNWSEPTDEEFQARVGDAIAAAAGGWVIDGNYEAKLGNTVIGAADTIVWLDLPLWLKVRRLWARTTRRIRDDVELWSGNRESWRGAFWGRDALFWWMLRGHFRHRREWPRLYGDDPRFVRLRSVEEAERWLEAQTVAPGPPGEDDRGMNDEGKTNLGTYLIRLGEDPDELKEFLRNPERAMRDAGVSLSDRDLVLCGDVEEIQKSVREELADGTIAYIVHPGNWPIFWPIHWPIVHP
jgi:adenylate kinase family enzyme